ncbi:MAG: ribonuclease PH [Anaerolineae bacterium]
MDNCSGPRRGRRPDQLRPVSIRTGYIEQAAGSALVSMGNTRVVCVATLSDGVPPWLAGKGVGWLTAEYMMLPYATDGRTDRQRGLASGRTQEIRRLVGRSLRMAVDRSALGERTLTVDCDVLRADGGTRTASITGAYVAVAQAMAGLRRSGALTVDALSHQVAAISVGMLDGCALLDLDYSEDSRADVDLNVVMTSEGTLVEVQGTGEGAPFTRAQLGVMLELAEQGLERLFRVQQDAIETGKGDWS